jgi:GDP-D-mannose dehydratase
MKYMVLKGVLPHLTRIVLIIFTRIPHDPNPRFKLHYGDLTDSLNVTKIIKECQPDEIYNLGAMSHVKVSFDIPEYVGQVDALGPFTYPRSC